MKDYLLNRIWEELKQANVNMYYAEIIIDKQKTMQTDGVDKICRLYTETTIYFNSLQDLFLLATYNKIDDETALTRFTALLNNNAKKQTDISRIFGKINKKDENKAREKSETYLESIYFK